MYTIASIKAKAKDLRARVATPDSDFYNQDTRGGKMTGAVETEQDPYTPPVRGNNGAASGYANSQQNHLGYNSQQHSQQNYPGYQPLGQQAQPQYQGMQTQSSTYSGQQGSSAQYAYIFDHGPVYPPPQFSRVQTEPDYSHSNIDPSQFAIPRAPTYPMPRCGHCGKMLDPGNSILRSDLRCQCHSYSSSHPQPHYPQRPSHSYGP